MKYSLMTAWLLTAAISACSSAPSKPQPSTAATFVTHIDDDGTKLFVFSLQSPQASGSGNHGRGGMHHGGHSSMSNQNQNAPTNSRQQSFNDLLQAKLTDSGFCRNGYVEQDRAMASGFMSVRGQCKDKATPEDLIRFKNTDD